MNLIEITKITPQIYILKWVHNIKIKDEICLRYERETDLIRKRYSQLNYLEKLIRIKFKNLIISVTVRPNMAKAVMVFCFFNKTKKIYILRY